MCLLYNNVSNKHSDSPQVGLDLNILKNKRFNRIKALLEEGTYDEHFSKESPFTRGRAPEIPTY